MCGVQIGATMAFDFGTAEYARTTPGWNRRVNTKSRAQVATSIRRT
jgi:hypothetical protein